MKDIRIKWNKKERDVEVNWNAGSGKDAGFFVDLFSADVQEEIKNRGYDIETIKFSITKMESNNNH